MNGAFSRVRAFAALLTAALGTGLSMPAALAEIGGNYRSRGKGLGKRSGRKVPTHVCNNGGRGVPHQSTRECQRRLRQRGVTA